jgi:hypothetical protein
MNFRKVLFIQFSHPPMQFFQGKGNRCLFTPEFYVKTKNLL